jgi:hypothetical protein
MPAFLVLQAIVSDRFSGAMPTGPAFGRHDGIEPGIARFPDAQLRI